MIEVQIARQFEVRSTDGRRLTAEQMHAEGERLMQALLDLEKCNTDFCDSSTASDADRGTIVVELMVTAASETAAVEKSLTLARTAIHTIGGLTPWDVAPDPAEPTTDYRPRNVQLEYV